MNQYFGESARTPSWYVWRLQHWGVKHDLTADVCEFAACDGELEYVFDTPWSPPTAPVTVLAARFPEVELRLVYSEPGMGFAGVNVWHGTHNEERRVEDRKAAAALLRVHWPDAPNSSPFLAGQ